MICQGSQEPGRKELSPSFDLVSVLFGGNVTGEGFPARAGEVEAAPQATILVVEDEVLVRMVVAKYLRDCGFQVIEASNAEEAVRALVADGTIRLVFSDVNMPGQMDGIGLARWLRQERPAIKILLASGAGWATDSNIEGTLRLTKPYSFPEIDRLIRVLLAED